MLFMTTYAMWRATLLVMSLVIDLWHAYLLKYGFHVGFANH